MKLPKFAQKRKLEASARRVPQRVAQECDEPEMKLSSAFVVVLVLHIVAVGGIYAFNSIKARTAAPITATASVPAKIEPKLGPQAPEPEIMPVARHESPAAAEKPVAARKTEPAKLESAKPSDAVTKVTPKAAASGETYTVVKGDNPVGIAKKLKCDYAELLSLNGIEDPRKLQIGQKLKVPKSK